MASFFAGILCLPPLFLLSSVCLTARFSNRHVTAVMRLITGMAALNVMVAVGALALTSLSGPAFVSLPLFGRNLPLAASAYLDGVSSLMLVLVASVGWVVCRFSVRYLDGEPHQGNYFRWAGFTIGAVSFVVIAGNLAMLTLALLLTSIGLHQLLVHYADRPAAHRAASIKFVFSRLGDLCLVAASVLLYREFGTLELPEIFASAATLSEDAIAENASISAIGWLLALCAVFKSAQFPFHTWLPDTMEAPTPVSALMHAGIVNAGGYLLIRMATIVTLAPAAMLAVAGLGAFTAIFAALVMLSQTNVKRSLAWSTIAQMGFMMLQCGLGAFSAAVLHIIAHSLYKAHAFLSSGSVMSERFAMATPPARARTAPESIAVFWLATATTVLMFVAMASAAGISMESKPGGYLLGFILCLGLSRWMWRMMQNGRPFVLPGAVVSALLIAAYLAGFKSVDAVIAGSFEALPAIPTSNGFMITVAAVFALIFALEFGLRQSSRSSWLQSIYIHSSNGFYFDTFWRRLAKSFSL